MSRAELHAITEIDLQRFDYRERVQRLKQRVIAAKTNSLPVMSTAEFFCYFMPDIPQGGMSGFFALKFRKCKGFSPEVINEIMNRFDAIAEEFVNVMAYTRISHTRNGRAAIQYARGNGRGHNGHAKRNLLILRTIWSC